MQGDTIEGRPTTAASGRLRRPQIRWRVRGSWRLLIYVVLVVGAVLELFPLFWLLSSSFKNSSSIFVLPPQWIPDPFQPSNYAGVFKQIAFARFYLNTAIITILATAGQVASSAVVGYGFARLRVPGRRYLFMLLIATILIPYPVTLIPTYILFKYLGWVNTFAPLIVPSWLGGSALFIFLMRQFCLRLSTELEDAAKIDGAGAFQIFLRVVTPQLRPAMGVVAVISFLATWNDFLGPLIYLNSQSKFTLALGINLLKGEYSTEWNLLMAASVMATVPPIILFAVAQRYFIQGVVFSGFK